jgi:hypothetical protein
VCLCGKTHQSGHDEAFHWIRQRNRRQNRRHYDGCDEYESYGRAKTRTATLTLSCYCYSYSCSYSYSYSYCYCYCQCY